MITYSHIPIIATSVFVIIMSVLIIYLIKVAFKEKEQEEDFERQLKFALDPERSTEEEDTLILRLLKHLPNLMKKAGIIEDKIPNEDIQRRMLLIGALLFTIITFFAGNILGGIIAVVICYTAVLGFCIIKISNLKTLMNDQIPAFVSTFKANIQANQHSQNAMIRAIENTASPLYDELSYAKAIMEAGDFRPGIIALRQSTDNETLRQMASCIELASASGSNIEDQISIIEDIIEDKQIIDRKRKLGINENKPLFLVSALFVPVSFIGSYFMSEMHKDFWFDSFLSWAVIIGVLITMAIATFATWKVIQKVEI